MIFNVINALSWAAQETVQTGAAEAADQAQKTPGGLSLSNPMFLVAAIFALFYLLILRPQKREQKQRQQMIDSMKKGDRVVSAGGIHGTVESIDAEKNIVTVNVAPKISIKFSRASITAVTDKNAAKGAEAAEGDK